MQTMTAQNNKANQPKTSQICQPTKIQDKGYSGGLQN